MHFNVLIAVLICSSTLAAQDPPLEPSTLLNWLRIIDMPNAKLLYAGDVNGSFYAIKIDKDGDLLLCNFEHTKTHNRNSRVYNTDVLTAGGDVLDDHTRIKNPPKPIKIKYSSASSIVTVAYTRGAVLELPSHHEKTLTVRFTEIVDGIPVVLLQQKVDMPLRRDR